MNGESCDLFDVSNTFLYNYTNILEEKKLYKYFDVMRLILWVYPGYHIHYEFSSSKQLDTTYIFP